MTDNTSQVPQWAKERACDLANAERPLGGWTTHDAPHNGAFSALARYIAATEEAPVDPLDDILTETFGYGSPVRADLLRKALSKRGLKIVGDLA